MKNLNIFTCLRFSILFLFLIPLGLALYAQPGSVKMFFGGAYNIPKLDFSTPPPTFSPTGLTDGFEGIAYGEDTLGNVNFIAKKSGIYRMPSGVMMPGSAGFCFHNSSTEMAAVEVPGQPGKYYVIYNKQICSELYYTIVDMSLAGGAGDVVPGTLNTLLTSDEFSEGFEIIPIGNACSYTGDYWLITYQCNVGFVRWTISSAGITNRTPLMAFVPGALYDGRGELEYYTGRIGMACAYDTPALVADFDPVTGLMSNPDTIITSGTGFSAGCYGLEFSPDGSKAYFSDWYNNGSDENLFIYDFNTGTQTNFLIPTAGGGFGQIELGIDGKLYSPVLGSYDLFVIDNPNASPGSLVMNMVPGPTFSQMSLGVSKSYISASTYFASGAGGSFAGNFSTCISGPSWVYAPTSIDSVQWFDSNGVLVAAGDSFFAPAVSMIYSFTGVNSCSGASMNGSMAVGYVDAAITVSMDTICAGDSLLVQAGAGNQFSWSTGSWFDCPTCQSSMASPPLTGYLSVVVMDSVSGCSDTDSVMVYVGQLTTAVIDSIPDQCYIANSVDLTQSGSYPATANFNWQMPGGIPNSSSLENPTGINYLLPGTQMVTLTVTDYNCASATDTAYFDLTFPFGCAVFSLAASVPTGTDSPADDQVIGLFPNPSDGHITLTLAHPANISWQLVRMDGAVIRSGNLEGSQHTLDFSDVASGVYGFVIEGERVRKLVINY